MLTFLAAAVMQPAAAAPAVDPDTRCMAAYLFVVGQMADDKTVSEEDKAGVSTIVMYFFGKLRARKPSADLAREIGPLIDLPNYVQNELKTDVDRCGAEFEQRTKELDGLAGK